MRTLQFAFLAAACAALGTARGDETPWAATAVPATFAVYTENDATYAALSAADIAALPPITWRKGETVTATAWDGAASNLVVSAASTGTVAAASCIDRGGVWTFANSAQGTARLAVAWTVFDDGGALLAQSGASDAYRVESEQSGPNRRVRRKDVLPIAYSGDDWAGDETAAATLTFVAPDSAETELVLAGSGAAAWRFSPGDWTVRLAMADGSEREAVLSIISEATVVSIR